MGWIEKKRQRYVYLNPEPTVFCYFSKSKAKNKNPPAKTEKISKYFRQNQVESKTCNQVLDDSLDDFKSPATIKTRSQTTWNLNKNPPKTRTTGRKKVAKNSTLEIIKENFGVNGEHMQMAIALSKSTYEAEYGHSSDSASKTETTDLSAILQNVKPTNLEQFGFKSTKNVLPVLNPKPKTVNQPSKKNRFKYITPILNLRSKEERESLIQQKISEILKSNVPPQPKIKTNVTYCHGSKLQNLVAKNRLIWSEIDYFYVDSLGLDKDTCKCGHLLRDWSSIPGRDKSPVKTVQKLSSDSRCLSPDLFESEDELDRESPKKSTHLKENNKRNMSTKANSIDLTGSDLEEGIGSSSSAKPASFYSLDEFELDEGAFCGKGNNESKNPPEIYIEPLTAPEEFNLNESSYSYADFQKCDGKTDTSDQVECNQNDSKVTDSLFNSLKEGFLEDEFMIEDHYIVKSESADNNTLKNINNTSQDINKDQSLFSNEIHVENLDSRRDLPETSESAVCIEISDDSSMDSNTKASQSLSKLEPLSQHSPHKRKLNHKNVSFDFTTLDISTNCPPNSCSTKKLPPNSLVKENYLSFNHDFVNYELESAENAMESSHLKAKAADEVHCSLAESKFMNIIAGDVNDSLPAFMEFNTSLKKIAFQSSVADDGNSESVTDEFVFNDIKNTSLVSKELNNLADIDSVSQHSPKTSSALCIEKSDDSSMDSNTKGSQSLSKLERLSQHSLHKRKFNHENVSFDFTTLDISANSPPNSCSTKKLPPNSPLKENFTFNHDFVNNDLTVNYELESAENEMESSHLKAKAADEVHCSLAKSEFMNIIADDVNDSLPAFMEYNTRLQKIAFQSSVADDIRNTSLVSKELNNLEDIDSVSQHSPKTSSAPCIEISDDSSTDENNMDFQSNLNPTTPKVNFSTTSGKSPNKKSLNINSAELNITDYVQEMLNKDNYTFDELKLSQSSQIDDEELNYSCHFNTPLKAPNLEYQKEVPSKEKSPSPTLRANTPDNYIIKTRNVTPMPDFDSMTTPAINRELEKVGVKALKRARGAQLLKYIYESTHPLVGSVDAADSDDEGKVIKRRKKNYTNDIEVEDSNQIEILGDRLLQQEKPEDFIFERRRSTKIPSCPVPLQIVWHNLVSSNPSIKESILLYEPLHLESLHDMLKQLGYKYHIQDLLSFLDKKCITIRTTQGKRPNK